MVQNNPLDYWDYLGMSTCGKSWWDKTKEVVSTVVDVVPVAGTVKSVVETVTGKDPITGEPVNRAVAAAGIGASLIPGGKAALKTGVKAASALSDGAKSAAKNTGKLSKVQKSKTVEQVGNGKFTKTTEVRPGKGPGQSRAEYVRYKNTEGKTIRTYKDTYDRAGNFQHRKSLRGGPEGRPQ